MTTSLFLEPLDVLYLRGNRLFQGAGAYGEALMPPWPSLVAGAVRSRMLADARVDFHAFAGGARVDDPRLHKALGTAQEPGAFRIEAFTLARRPSKWMAGDAVEPYVALPSDVVVTDGKRLDDATYVVPRELPIRTSAGLPMSPVLASAGSGKPITGLWLNGQGWRAYLAGHAIKSDHLVRSSHLWELDPRLGIALDRTTGTAARGMLYTAETVGVTPGVGFLVSVQGADGLLPSEGLLRLGGDGRGAAVVAADVQWPEPDWGRIEREQRFRMVLTTPGVFSDGWRLPGVSDEGSWQGPDKTKGELVAAAVPRAGVVSGWDLALRCPKPAVRTAPVGAVYWIENLRGGVDGLRKVAAEGLWQCMADNEIDDSRRAEGFNNVQIAAWPRSENQLRGHR